MSDENVNADEWVDPIETFILSGNVRGGRGGGAGQSPALSANYTKAFTKEPLRNCKSSNS